jgi:hypothetical protein
MADEIHQQDRVAHDDAGECDEADHRGGGEGGAEQGVADDDEDYALPIYAERLPVRTVIGAPEPCPRLLEGVGRPSTLAGYSAGRLLEEALTEAHRMMYPG